MKVKVDLRSILPLSVEVDAVTFGYAFSNMDSDDQIEVFRSMVDNMKRFPVQWDYISIALDNPENHEIRDKLYEISCGSKPDETDDNARLIAAAPDLLDHAKLFARALEYQIKKDHRDGDDEGANLRAVTLARVNDDIAKAEGRS